LIQETQEKARRAARNWLLSAWLLLVGVLLIWWLSDPHGSRAALFVAKGLAIMPLLLVLPAIARGSRPASAASTLMLTFYMGWTVTELVANPSAHPIAGVALIITVACFFLLVLWLRVLPRA